MLTHLQLRDLAIVDRAELELGPGLTALTGETGAGKSIVVDALLLVGGGRGGGDVVRAGADRAEVTARFSDVPEAARCWLEAQALDHENEAIMRRIIGSDGRSRAYVNGQLVTVQQLKDLAARLIDIHGQQEFQHLVKRSAQRELLDALLDDPSLVRSVSDAYAAVRDCRFEHRDLAQSAADREARSELLKHQLGELKADVTTVAAIDELFADQKRLASRGRLGAVAQHALEAVFEADEGSAHDRLARAAAALRTAAELDPDLAAPAQLLAEATIATHEAATALRRYLDSLDMDPSRQDEVERRAASLEALARKHRVGLRELPLKAAELERQLDGMNTMEASLAELERRRGELERQYRAAAEQLSKARHAAADALTVEVTALMQSLGMAGGRFAVRLERVGAEVCAHGLDEVEFLVSANPGQPLKGLAKVASGGELSRISLAIQVAGAAGESGVCMVFDEIDAGIGGGIAEIVGRQLRNLGARAQVLCVTHLAQVAAQAHAQFRVVKRSDGAETRTAVESLSSAERVEEIARMLGGIDVTPRARAHAREMLGPVEESSPDAAAGLREKARKARSQRAPR